ncbi:alpha/beta hydrolase [Sphingopyxis sp. BSN-002]|uniref:alpha/beta hydrolase n=1 Tax=Sphingopyxis sp. BSN-002 TaxID=2911495 RepID=UPI001EDBEE31|nr:alpha/beta hydrolase [Sphingopyxis sp. BSN-002]UKK83453.1 alpha/beta hydrolase [Sphingopyxis sp. BSN-002]
MTIVRIALFGLFVIVALYAGAAAILYFSQRGIFYPAPRDYPREALPGFGSIETRTEDGLRLTALYRPAAPGHRTIVFFHGNGDNLAGAAEATRGLAASGSGVLLVEYRGYAGNPGSPDEAGFYRDGEAAMNWLAGAGVAPSQIVIVGNSIGSGPATEMALRHPVAGLILVSGFSSLPDVAGAHVRWLPVRALVSDRFANADKIARVHGEVLILHGDHDALVSVANARRLHAARPRSTLTIVPGAGHELVYGEVAQRAMTDWVAGLR